jgi:ketosteroid isomerase-like protein
MSDHHRCYLTKSIESAELRGSIEEAPVTTIHPPDEVRAAVDAYVEYRERIDRGEADWSGLARFYTADAVLVDPAWGRVEGRAAIEALFKEAMAGLDGFTYPIEFTAISGNDVVVKWLQVAAGLGPDGRPLVHSGVSTMLYAGDGLFSYEEDLMNVAQVGADLVAAGWRPGPGFTPPPPDVDRNFERP